jgi:peptidoglycan/xylan/chitin deacetylase (PgdA/CDA1 family)
VRRWHALVLCYHAVSEDWPHGLSVSLGTFEQQLTGLLGRGFRPVAAPDVLRSNGKTLHVTFDDAFRSVERALPVLERLGMPSTVFACSGFAGEGRALDVPELEAQVEAYPDDLATMDWDALRGLAERGVEVGSHTVSHPHLPRLTDVELQRELRESRERIADELTRPCRYLAYPFGDEDARVRSAAAVAGYDAAFALPGREDRIERFALPRVGVYRGDSVMRMRLKTTAGFRRPVAALLRMTGQRR